jgi:citrate lyase subunit beta/citryl-CoA lyase
MPHSAKPSLTQAQRALAQMPLRSALFMPATNPRALAKARDLPADIIVIDLEDAVAPERKDEARAAALQAIYAGGFGHRLVAVRVNGLDTPWGADDLAALAHAGTDAVLVPKVNGPQDVLAYHEALTGAAGDLQLWTMIETAASVLNLAGMAALARSTRLALWVVGTNDLAKDLRARPTPDRAVFAPYLALAVAAARSAGLAILDGVCNEFRDAAVVRAEAEQGRMFGFDGKSLIHPAQIGPCNAVFSPSEAEVARAQAIIAAFDQPENAGKGAIDVDGAMAELLHRDEARRVLALAERIARNGG